MTTSTTTQEQKISMIDFIVNEIAENLNAGTLKKIVFNSLILKGIDSVNAESLLRMGEIKCNEINKFKTK